MQTTSDRIAQRMKELGLQHKDLVAATGASKGTVTNWISGVNNPTNKRLVELAQVLKTTPSWLLTGNSTPEFTQVEPWDSNTPVDDDEVEIPFFKDFSFACGAGAIGEALLSEKRRLRMSKATLRNKAIDKKNAVATTSSGDSMSPTIKDGDTIHLDLGRKTIKDGKIFAICPSAVRFTVIITGAGRKRNHILELHVHGGDQGEPVITIGYPEDF